MRSRSCRLLDYLSVAEAEFLQTVLAEHDIASSLDNANFLSCVWHYSNAVHGVKLSVLDGDADKAREILHTIKEPPYSSGAPVKCSACTAEREPAWHVCWWCGAGSNDPDSMPEPSMEAIDAAEQTLNLQLISAGACLALVIIVGTYGLEHAAVVLGGVFLANVVFAQRPTSAEHGDEPHFQLPPADPYLENHRGDFLASLVNRAWRAAVLGILLFPPLFLYAYWLLRRLRNVKMDLPAVAKWQWRGVWVLTMAAVWMLVGLVVAAISIDVVDHVFYAVRNYRQ